MNYLTNYYKNLSEQLQDRVNLLQRMLKESEPNPHAEKMDRHQDIVDSIVKHMSAYPHKQAMEKGETHQSVSAEHIRQVLNSHPDAPFMNPGEAVEAIRPHAIEGNQSLEPRIYDKFQDEVPNDASELEGYENLLARNEESFTEELHDKVHGDVGHMKDAEDYR
jgi:hypothetical protein